MAWALHTYILDSGDDTIKVGHDFFGLTKAEAKDYFQEHIGSCEYFSAAVKEGRVYGDWEEMGQEDLPDAEEFEPEEVLTEKGEFA